MDAIEFIKKFRRMDENSPRKYSIYIDSPEDVVAEVEEWAKMNPAKTRQSVFLEQYPEAEIDNCGVLKVCPAPISVSHRNIYGKCAHTCVKCSDCRREFWMKEVDE